MTVSSVVSPEDGLFEWFAAEVLANAEALRGGADVGVTVVTLDERRAVGETAVSGSAPVVSEPERALPSSSVTCFSCGQTIDNEGERLDA